MVGRRQCVELRLGNRTIRLGPPNGGPVLMGIINVTPDSFSDGGEFLEPAAAIDHGEELVAQGADWLDIGGESTRPGAVPVPLDEELRRVMAVLEGLAGRVSVPLSIDTYKPEVARRAVAAGARIINDVTGFRDPAMIEVAARCEAACICMHMRGTSQTMQDLAEYRDVVGELMEFFDRRLAAMEAGGVAPERIIIDPGIGFAKKHRHNLEILRRLDELHALGRPVLVGASRKRFLGELTGRAEHERLSGTIATALYSYLRGVQVLRVHDVRPVREALNVIWAIENEPLGSSKDA